MRGLACPRGGPAAAGTMENLWSDEDAPAAVGRYADEGVSEVIPASAEALAHFVAEFCRSAERAADEITALTSGPA